jgi:hypothetical protein
MGDGATYHVDALSPCQEHADVTGHWEWIREYGNATIWLKNILGTAWYSPSDTNLDFVVSSSALTVKLRNPAGASNNPYAAYLEMEVSAHAGNTLLLATYSGYPAVTNVPETPDEWPYTLATGGLASARVALSLPDQIAGAAGLGIRVVAAPGSEVELFWNSATNRLYQVQRCASLSTGTWTDSGSPLVGVGTTLQARQTLIPSESQAFFRVLEYPGVPGIQGSVQPIVNPGSAMKTNLKERAGPAVSPDSEIPLSKGRTEAARL